MRFLRWAYHRIGQMFCFGLGLALVANDLGDMARTIGGAALLLTGLGLKAIDVWQRDRDPGRE